MHGTSLGRMATLGLMALFVGFVGCGDDPVSVNPPPDPPDPPPGDGRTVKATPSLATDVQEVFTRLGCSGGSCHGAAAAAGLDLSSASASFTSLVGVVATREPIVRVIPNNADGSYLVIKLEGRQTVGAQMPLGGSPPDTIDLNNIKNWINTGAPNN